MENDGLRILAQYERRKTSDPEATLYNETLRVDGQGIIPRPKKGFRDRAR